MQWLDTVCRESLDRPTFPVGPVKRMPERTRREGETDTVPTVLAVLGGALAMSTAVFLIAALAWVARL